MYLTAQHVRSQSGREGVNVYGYTHRGREGGIDWQHPDVVRIAEHEPGRLMFAMRAVEESGSKVCSFLDVAVSDDVPAKTVAALLEAASIGWRPDLMQTTAVWSRGSMAIRFDVAASLRSVAALEYRDLKDPLLLAIANIVTREHGVPAFPVRPSQPVRVFRRRGAASDRYVLEDASRVTLQRLLPGGVSLPASVNVSRETEEAFGQFLGGDLVADVVGVLTHCTVDQLDTLGGAVVVDEHSGERVWPSTRA